MTPDAGPRFVLCLSNDGYAASLATRKVYRTLPDEAAGRRGMVRVIDESGEDYLFSAAMFVAIELPDAVATALAAA